ncbi:MAG TPA: SRPBCC family protein [Solirubrobacteraceae bacterium]|nr:SRPBCC family protein [Solirubrobacteraceae bacterium]
MTVVHCSRDLPTSPHEVWWLLSDPSRWETFVEGFAAVASREGEWPAPGAVIEWDSTPHGRGRVRERVTVSEPDRELVVEVGEDRLDAIRRVLLGRVDGGVRVSIELNYSLHAPRWQRLIVDRLFVRRALADSLERELDGIAVELTGR